VKLRGRKQKKELAATIDRGRALFTEGRDDEAFEFLEKAVQRFPEDAEIRLDYATSLLAVRPEEVVAEAVKAIELDPDEPIRLTRAASLLFNRGEIETARSYVERAKRLATHDFSFRPELLNLESHFAAHDGNDEMAEDGLCRAMEQKPNGEMFAFDLAKFLVERNRREEALGIIHEALTRVNRKEPLERLRNEILGESSPQGQEYQR
jgi:tetratricopeptide (TPR) repeat protein